MIRKPHTIPIASCALERTGSERLPFEYRHPNLNPLASCCPGQHGVVCTGPRDSLQHQTFGNDLEMRHTHMVQAASSPPISRKIKTTPKFERG